MQKNALTVTLVSLVLGIFGAFLRWLQTRNVFEAETGLAVRGAPISIVYTVYSLLVIAVIAAAVLLWLRKAPAALQPGAALRCGSGVPKLLTGVLAAVFVCGALALLFTAGSSRCPLLQRVFGAAAIFGGLAFPYLLPRRDGTVSMTSRAAAVFLPLFFGLWLIFAYKLYAENPVLWAYAPEMLALAATTVGVYEVAAYYHNRAKPARALLALYIGAFLDISVLFDRRGAALTAMLAVCAALQLLLGHLLIENLGEPGD